MSSGFHTRKIVNFFFYREMCETGRQLPLFYIICLPAHQGAVKKTFLKSPCSRWKIFITKEVMFSQNFSQLGWLY